MLFLEKKDLFLEKIRRWGFGEGALKYKDARVHCQSLRHSEHHDRLSGKILPPKFCVFGYSGDVCRVCARIRCVCVCVHIRCVCICVRKYDRSLHLSAFASIVFE
jgi:hypothetical protein